jgi:4-carboxymuconolactone decarboxylase
MGLVDSEGSPEFTEVEKLALRYTVGLTATPVELPDDFFDAMRARFDPAFACEAEGFSEGAFCALPK